MNHPLDGARLKIIRAQEHIDSLKAEVRMYLDEEPYKVVAEHDGEHWKFVTTISVNPPLRFSTIIGDCVTNARAALDYIMFQLAQTYFTPPFDIRNRNDRKIVSFPLFEAINTNPNSAYMNRFNCLTNRMPKAADAIDMIKSSQPYNAGQQSLWWLHELVNEDKHRMPLLTIGHIVAADMEIMVRPTIDHLGWTLRSTGTKSVGFAADGSTIHPDDMEMNCQATGYVAWQDLSMPREPIDRTLEQIVERVVDVIPRFDRFLA